MTTTVATGLAAESFVTIEGETFYGIPNVDQMAPFLMSMISDSDHWMFISSTGGLTAGRWDANSALFPYETDDRLHLAAGITGPVTLVRTESGDVWAPFQGRSAPGVQRNLYKSAAGNQIIFEEINEGAGLGLRYRWSNSDEFGFVRTATLFNNSAATVSLEVLDGLLNLLPAGLDPGTYRAMSNFTNAYKRSEVIAPEQRLALFTLESLVSDRAEPSEALTATVAWSYGLEGASVSVDPAAVEAFLASTGADSELLLTGRPGAYLLRNRIELEPGEHSEWTLIADVARDQGQVAALRDLLASGDQRGAVSASIHAGTDSLVSLLASADSQQRTGDHMAAVHHYANVAFNSMRGGVFVSPTLIDRDQFAEFVAMRNREVAARHRELLEQLPTHVERDGLLEQVRATGDPQLIRLALGYLPLTFSRRHGDPSRPWNAFSIRVRDEAGDPVVHYEGNWRDIFQNWEALCLSFPEYLPSVISIFLSASTADGFNPYRLTSQGIDWEVPEPDNPWSNIGYWGDHQIVYLQRLLDLARRFDPAALDDMLNEALFSYADVPYRIAPYDSIVADPHATIEYDQADADRIEKRLEQMGHDGKLMASDGRVHLVTMVEKLLVPALAKLSNLVPGGGIWMNTQRPEWNDANNALVGNGLSIVTACYLRRHLADVVDLLERSPNESVALSTEVADWSVAIATALADNVDYIGGDLNDFKRRQVLDRLGEAFSDYRAVIYTSGFTSTRPVAVADVKTLCRSAIRHLDDTIQRNRRTDGLYHSYNLLHVHEDESASVEHLEAMLEGQVAVLGSGLLTTDEKLAVLEALFASAMYRPDQNSFMLYPPRVLPSFLDKNLIPQHEVAHNELLAALAAAGNESLIATDPSGNYRFSPACINQRALRSELERLGRDERWAQLVSEQSDAVSEVYESVFNHHAYTGRSGSMYGYEGIGSIYWHMVAKLLVAVQESVVEAKDADADGAAIVQLVDFYWRVRSGLGFEKTAAQFGAFPMDPYSHTPIHAGAQQPGMTGQVKEEILTRYLELGLRIDEGRIRFEPDLLRADAFVSEPTEWPFRTQDGGSDVLALPAYSLGLSFCQVPVVLQLSEGEASIRAQLRDGSAHEVSGLALDEATSAEVFSRSGSVKSLHVSIPRSSIRDGGSGAG